MKALERLGIKVDGSFTLDELLGEDFNGSLYGLTPAQMDRVRALKEVVAAYNMMVPFKGTVHGAEDAAGLVYASMKDLGHEEVRIAYLARNNRVIRTELLFTGGVSSVTMSVRDIIAKVLSSGATAVILYHNHPSGDPKPSPADIRVTSRLKEACDLMEVSLLDHIIIARGSYYSFAEERSFDM